MTKVIKLANPFHDKLGRFASKTGGVVSGAVKEGLKEFSKTTKEAVDDPLFVASAGVVGAALVVGGLKHSKEENARFDGFTQNAANKVPAGMKNPNLKIVGHNSIAGYTLGSQNPFIATSAGYVKKIGDKQANLSPMVKRWALSDDTSPQAQARRDFAEMATIHETLHTRPRNGTINVFNAHAKMDMEEGMNSLLAERVGKKADTAAYAHYRDGMARIALTLNDGDYRAARRWIDDAHKKSIGPMDVAGQLSAKTGKRVHWWDVSDYVKTESGIEERPTWLGGIIGKKSGYSRKFNSDVVKSRPNLDLDLKAHRLITGTAEALAAAYVTKTATGIMIGTAIGAAQGAWGEISKLESATNTPQVDMLLLAQVMPKNEFIHLWRTCRERAKSSGIPEDSIDFEFMRICGTTEWKHNREGFNEDELRVMYSEFINQ